MLTEDQKDTLKEIINIGFSRTAASLSELTNNRVILDPPEVELLPISNLSLKMNTIMPGKTASVVQVFTGKFSGSAMITLDYNGTTLLSDLLTGQTVIQKRELNDSDCEILAEVGNILLTACLSIFGNLLNVKITFSIPKVELEVLDSMLKSLVIKTEELQYSLVALTKFRVKQSSIQGCFTIIFGVSSLDSLINALDELNHNASKPEFFKNIE